MKQIFFFIACMMFVASVAIVSCQSGAQSLEGQTFLLTELYGDALSATDDDSAPYMTFSKGMLSSSVGCNNIMCAYHETGDGAIRFERGASTKMFCPEELREEEYLNALVQVTKYVVEGETISFYDADGAVLFKAQKKAE